MKETADVVKLLGKKLFASRLVDGGACKGETPFLLIQIILTN